MTGTGVLCPGPQSATKMSFLITNALRLISIRHQSDTKALNPCVNGLNPRVFANCNLGFHFHIRFPIFNKDCPKYYGNCHMISPWGGGAVLRKKIWPGCAAPVFDRIPLAKEILVENIPLAKENFLIMSPFLHDFKEFQPKYSLWMEILWKQTLT